MKTFTIITRHRPDRLRPLVALLPAILAGRVPDSMRLAEGFKLRLSVAFLSLVKLAFIKKSRGGTDEAGIKWQKLSRHYLAYGRRSELPALSRVKGRAVGSRVGKLAPGGKDGYMSKTQLKAWNRAFAFNFARLSASMPAEEAKGLAAAIAWNQAKQAGVKTKLDVLGGRQVEILRDTGTLFNSLDCGIEATDPAAENYTPKPDQLIKLGLGSLIVGTKVPYADYHQNGTGRRSRKIFPDTLPPAWLDEITEATASGITRALYLAAQRMAA